MRMPVDLFGTDEFRPVLEKTRQQVTDSSVDEAGFVYLPDPPGGSWGSSKSFGLGADNVLQDGNVERHIDMWKGLYSSQEFGSPSTDLISNGPDMGTKEQHGWHSGFSRPRSSQGYEPLGGTAHARSLPSYYNSPGSYISARFGKFFPASSYTPG